VGGLPGHLIVEANQSIRCATDDFLMRFLGRPKMNLDAAGKIEAAVDWRTHLRYETDYWHAGAKKLPENYRGIAYFTQNRLFTHNSNSRNLTIPGPLLAPRFHSRASAQPHARPRVLLLPADLLLNTAEWGREKQRSSRGHISPGRMTASS
jgi:hypothetical protein